ncbi:hypothetical protein ZHAS_00005022 [Anopheles sinensis]|uniref:FHA domain-containing protein n=1 Tax=Anopheles sinensis TaxID=74873 RepID=A0A084VIC0_ANOSI|nr:hypothetical protein ZHAS_00005022 [Anopheles sinensis]
MFQWFSRAQAKVGRSVARIRVSENNAIFDCKVLSRNHAVLWYKDGRFFIKDTGSSNGTFINNLRLSQSCTESEPYEISSGDIVQFGVDVMENTRRETHGCITATLKLFLPDGRETKASQKVGIGGQSTIIPPVDLYRLNQYIQEANQREQILETKLISLQKMVESTKQNSFLGWQALIDEDRLLSRIDMLEKKLQYCQKNITEDKLREELLKLLDEKEQYQNAAKEAMYKLHQERHEAVHKQISLEKALCTSEDECSLLREQLNKTKQQLQEITVCMDTLKSQYDEKVASSEEQLKAKESEITSLTHKLDHFVDVYAIGSSDDEQQQQINSSAMSNWLKNSDIKMLEGSEEIIKAICNDTENDITNSDYTEGLTKLQRRISTFEKNFALLIGGDGMSENESNELDNETSEPTVVTGPVVAKLTGSEDNAAGEGKEEGGENGPPAVAESIVKQECDGNQNDVNSTSTTSNVTGRTDGDGESMANQQELAPVQHIVGGDMKSEPEAVNILANGNKESLANAGVGGQQAPPYGAVDPINQNVLKRNIRLIKNDCMTLLRQAERTIAQKHSEQASQKAKYDELESELLAFKAELESRPKQTDLDQKQALCDSLAESLSTLRIEVEELRTMNDRCQQEMERMELELLKQKNFENEKISALAAAAAAAAAAVTVDECKVVVETPMVVTASSAKQDPVDEVVQEKSSSTPETESREKEEGAARSTNQQQELLMMPTTLLVVTENAPVAEMPSPVMIPSVPMVDVETQTDVEYVGSTSSTSMTVPTVLPLPIDTSDGGDTSISSNLDDLDDDDEDDDDEKTETIDAMAIFSPPELSEAMHVHPGEPDSEGKVKPLGATAAAASVTNGGGNLMPLPATLLAGGEQLLSTMDDASSAAAAALSIDLELAMINHPDVQREEELIAFKEKYTHLSEENVRLNQQLQRLSGELSQSRHWSAVQLAMYIAPIVAIFGYILLNRT